MKPLIIFCLLIVIFDSCIDPFDIKSSGLRPNLVVEGMITDQQGPYSVKLFYSSELGNQLDKINWTKGASVVVYDDEGSSEILSEISPGNYQTSVNGIQGVVGRTYYLKITTQQEEIYESLPEKLLPAGDLENLYFEFEKNVNPEDEDYLESKNGFNIYVDATTSKEQSGFTRWRTTGVFEILTAPEKQTKIVALKSGDVAIVPDIPPCAFGLNGCECCTCWVTNYDEIPILSEPQFAEAGIIKKYKIAFIPANRRSFYNKYHLEVEQISLSESVFKFWENVKKQKLSGSDLFQTPPPRTTGNIKLKTKGVEALGYFGASSIVKRSIFIKRSDIPYGIPLIDELPMSCLKPYRYSTALKPPFW
jgi:hypothetical protein